MATVTVTRNAQVTIPKEIRDALDIREGDRVTMRVEGKEVVIEKVAGEVWSDCTDFLVDGFEKVLAELRADSRRRFRNLGVIS